jgi:hypothetical protein
MSRDVKEVVGVLMRVLDGAEMTQADVEDLGFEGEGDVQAALNDAYIKLLEFVHDRDARQRDRSLDRTMRERLQTCLDRITIACDREAQEISNLVARARRAQ